MILHFFMRSVYYSNIIASILKVRGGAAIPFGYTKLSIHLTVTPSYRIARGATTQKFEAFVSNRISPDIGPPTFRYKNTEFQYTTTSFQSGHTVRRGAMLGNSCTQLCCQARFQLRVDSPSSSTALWYCWLNHTRWVLGGGGGRVDVCKRHLDRESSANIAKKYMLVYDFNNHD